MFGRHIVQALHLRSLARRLDGLNVGIRNGGRDGPSDAAANHRAQGTHWRELMLVTAQ
jgi:hypothetical protein